MRLSEKQLKNMIAESVKVAINEIGHTKKSVRGGLSENKVRSLINKKVRQVINEGVEEDYRIYEEQLALQIFGMSFLDFYSKGGLFHTEEDLAKMSEYFDRLSTWREENNYKGRGF